MEKKEVTINLEDVQTTLAEKEMIILQLRSMIRNLEKEVQEKDKKIIDLEKERKK